MINYSEEKPFKWLKKPSPSFPCQLLGSYLEVRIASTIKNNSSLFVLFFVYINLKGTKYLTRGEATCLSCAAATPHKVRNTPDSRQRARKYLLIHRLIGRFASSGRRNFSGRDFLKHINRSSLNAKNCREFHWPRLKTVPTRNVSVHCVMKNFILGSIILRVADSHQADIKQQEVDEERQFTQRYKVRRCFY